MSSAVKKSQTPEPYPNSITYICISRRENDHIETPRPRHGKVIYVTKGKMLGWGGTAILEKLPSGTVMKTPISNPYCRADEESQRRNMRLEDQIYARIGGHARVPKLIHWDPKACCREMECLENGDLKEYFLQNHQNITPQLRLRWSRQAAEALTVLHGVEVIHYDLSPRNFLLDSNLDLKIADFGGAALCGSDPSATPASRFRHPGYDWNIAPVFGDDIFSLGSLIYFIMTGSYPYEDVSSDEVEKLYDVQQFPDVSSIVCGAIVMQCWRRQVDSAQVIHDCITAIEREKTRR
jgi:serine/threonine protein kinase